MEGEVGGEEIDGRSHVVEEHPSHDHVAPSRPRAHTTEPNALSWLWEAYGLTREPARGRSPSFGFVSFKNFQGVLWGFLEPLNLWIFGFLGFGIFGCLQRKH